MPELEVIEKRGKSLIHMNWSGWVGGGTSPELINLEMAVFLILPSVSHCVKQKNKALQGANKPLAIFQALHHNGHPKIATDYLAKPASVSAKSPERKLVATSYRALQHRTMSSMWL